MVLGGQVQSQLLEDCCRIFYESILSCEDKTCPQVTAVALHILQQSAFLSCVLSLIMLSAPNSDKHRMETEQPQFKYWALVLDFQLCVLQLVRPVSCGDYHP